MSAIKYTPTDEEVADLTRLIFDLNNRIRTAQAQIEALRGRISDARVHRTLLEMGLSVPEDK